MYIWEVLILIPEYKTPASRIAVTNVILRVGPHTNFTAHTNVFSVSNLHLLCMHPLHKHISFLPASCPPLPLIFPHCTVQNPPTVDCKPPTTFFWALVCIIYQQTLLLHEGKLFLTAQMSVVLHTIVLHTIVWVTCTWTLLCMLTNTDQQSPRCSHVLI